MVPIIRANGTWHIPGELPQYAKDQINNGVFTETK